MDPGMTYGECTYRRMYDMKTRNKGLGCRTTLYLCA